jgi:hypothetical protein
MEPISQQQACPNMVAFIARILLLAMAVAVLAVASAVSTRNAAAGGRATPFRDLQRTAYLKAAVSAALILKINNIYIYKCSYK